VILRPLFKFLFFHLPRILFQVAGLVRTINRGKRAFQRGLESENLPEELVEELMREFDPTEGFGLREVLNFPRKKRESAGGFSAPLLRNQLEHAPDQKEKGQTDRIR